MLLSTPCSPLSPRPFLQVLLFSLVSIACCYISRMIRLAVVINPSARRRFRWLLSVSHMLHAFDHESSCGNVARIETDVSQLIHEARQKPHPPIARKYNDAQKRYMLGIYNKIHTNPLPGGFYTMNNKINPIFLPVSA